MRSNIIVTGASGLLGRAVHAAFGQAETFHVLGLTFSRPGDGLVALDLLDAPAVERVFSDFRPQWVIHCAAERRPDVAEKDPDHATRLNVEVPRHLAALSSRLHYRLVYISTDYVFDGTSPPYDVDAPTNPVNLYGRTKRDGELAVLGVPDANAIILRIPVLYGPTGNNAESAINILLDVVRDQSGKQYKMDDYQIRYPTNVLDIARFLVRLTTLEKPTPPILHFTSLPSPPYTKYTICLLFARLLNLPHAHILPDSSVPGAAGAGAGAGAGGASDASTKRVAVTRPHDCCLDVRRTEALLGTKLDCVEFEEWWIENIFTGLSKKKE